MIGQKFGRLRVISDTSRWNYKLCRCRCGKEKEIRKDALLTGRTRSCGCLLSEVARKKIPLLARANTKTGLSNTPVHRCWVNMRYRCNNPNASGYADYGGRGIRVCDRWNDSFENFLADMGRPPSSPRKRAWSLERIDNNGDYSPENCRWATPKIQHNNKRNNCPLTLNGETKTIRQWSEATGIAYSTIYGRLKCRHWTIEQALTTPPGCRRPG